MRANCVFRVENLTQVHRQNVDITAQMEKLVALGSCTIVVRFRHSEVPSFSPLLNVVNSQYPSSFFMLYSQSAYRVGLMRKKVCENGISTQILNVYDNHQAQMNVLNTLACTIEENVGYKLYLNGMRLREYRDPGACFLRDIMELAPIRAALIGKAVESQKLEFDRPVFLGDIDFLCIYDDIWDDGVLLSTTGQTFTDTSVRIPANTFCSQPVHLFYPGYMGSENYRMPSLLRTKKGTLLAAIDQRMHGPMEHPNKIHIVLRRSTDLGQGFGQGITVVQMPENSQSIDSCMLQDEETGRIFLLTDQFSENTTLFSVSMGTGFETAGGGICRQLLDDNGVKYLEDGRGAITCEGKPTPYTTGSGYRLFKNGTFVGYIFSERCPLRVFPTSYLVVVYSDDDGQTWSEPVHLNPFVKEDWMGFLGCGPGRGIQLRHGPHAGRLLFPVYFVNPNGVQCAALIYSDDHGKTWTRGESCNDQRLFDGMLYHSRTLSDKRLDTNEAQAVELPDGTVLLFAKSPFNDSGCVAVAVSENGGESFGSVLHFDPALHSTDSLAVISSPCKIDGCDALLYAGGDSVSGSSNGAVKIGLLNPENPRQIEWKYSRLVKPGTFGHCSLSMISDTILGLFYESSGGLDMSFVRMDLPFIKVEDLPVNPVELDGVTYSAKDGGVLCTLQFNQPVMLCGDRRIKISLSRRSVVAYYESRSDDGRAYSFLASGGKADDIQGFSASGGLRVFAVNGMCYRYSHECKKFVWQHDVNESNTFFSLFSSHIDTFDDSKRIVSSGDKWEEMKTAHTGTDKPAGALGIRCDSEQMVQSILSYVQTNYALPLTLREIAQSINVNAAYLGRIFHRRVGSDFKRYLAQCRITKAREFLKDDGLAVAEIAQMVGYNDVNTFYIVFKRQTGMSPAVYRAKLLDKLQKSRYASAKE